MGTAGELIETWALRVAAAARHGVATLRDRDGIEVSVDGAHVWLRGTRADATTWQALAAVADSERFVVDAHGDCRAPGSRLPATTLPRGPWVRLRDWSRVAFATPALAGTLPAPVPLALERDTAVAEPSVLRCRLVALARWADDAADVRLRCLRFAANVAGDALVHGLPTPPLPGEPFVVSAGIAVPAGWRLANALPPALLAAKLALGDGDLAVLAIDGSCTILRSTRFVQLARSAVRATLAEVARG